MKLSKNAMAVLQSRYLLRDDQGKIVETPEGMFRRVAGCVVNAEQNYGERVEYWSERFFRLMHGLKFLPNSPALMNAGKDIGQLAACFVLPVSDSMDSIFSSLKNAALILQSGGGTGFSFSQLRPKSDVVRSTGGIASGPVSFMRVFDTATEVIKQGGARRGANMGILRIDHPDILDFIRMKRRHHVLENFNISVAVTDDFMGSLKSHGTFQLRNPRTQMPVKTVRAEDIFDEIVESAWLTGDPGIIFIDTINRFNPTPKVGTIESTNPCGEQPLLPNEACVLGSLNLARYIARGRRASGIDYAALSDDIETAVRFLDDAIDVNRYPLKAIELMHRANRKIGLGVMGWADMLISLGIPYDSEAAFRLAEEIMKFIRDKARESSAQLARERGPFPNYPDSFYASHGFPPLRNATLTTIAPTGTLSIIADCSSGIEPLFALAYKRMILDNALFELNRHFINDAKRLGLYSESLKSAVIRKGGLRGIRGLPGELKRLYRTAHEIHFKDHVEMQARFQLFTDNAVSKTINLPHSAGKSDVAEAFLLAYEKQCKGITVFRYGTKKRGTLVRIADTD